MTDLALTLRLEAAVLAVPGVLSLFSVEPALVRSAKELAIGPTSLISVTGPDDAPTVTVSVGVDASSGAPATATTVAAAIRAAWPDGVSARVVVRISRVSAL